MNLTASIASARSFLFVPGNRPERFAKALASGADAVVLDLEDSVPEADKAAARLAIAAARAMFEASPAAVVVRINGMGSAHAGDDLNALLESGLSVAVMLSKSESAEQLAQVHARLPMHPLLALIESAAGLDQLTAIAAAPGLLRLVVGHVDFMADTGLRCSDDERELDGLRFAVAMQTRLKGLAPAVDGVTVDIADDARLQRDTRRALHFGFGAKLCIHPRQVAGVHQALAPTAAELDWARRVVAADQASGGAAVQLDGRMVDLPVVLQARATLARACEG